MYHFLNLILMYSFTNTSLNRGVVLISPFCMQEHMRNTVPNEVCEGQIPSIGNFSETHYIKQITAILIFCTVN